jgi:uncharacterized membrane-anchored protein
LPFTALLQSSRFSGGIGEPLTEVLIAAPDFATSISRTFLFWSAFILTRPLGATVGDLLTKACENGGLNLGRIVSSLVIAAVIQI